MQNLNRMLQLAQAASFIGDLARQKHTHTLPTRPESTIYIHADDAALRIVRWERAHVEATIETMPPVGWRVATDHDDNGVYIVAMKRIGFAVMAKANMNVLIPRDAHLVLRMDNGMVSLDHVQGTLSIAPPVGLLPGNGEASLPDGISE